MTDTGNKILIVYSTTDGHAGEIAGHDFVLVGASWQLEEGSRVLSVCVITTTPNEVMSPIHDRMPVILPDSLHDTWLDVRTHDTDALKAILLPAEAAATQAWPVSLAVSQARNDGVELIAPVVGSLSRQ